MSQVTVVQFMLQLNFVFVSFIQGGSLSLKVFTLLGMKLLKIVIRVSLNNSTWELICFPLKALSQLKDLIAKFMASILPFL